MDLVQEALPVVIYQREGESVTEVRLEGGTVWLTQRQMAELFDTSSDNVGLHLKNIYGTGELEESTTTEDYSVVQREGRRQVTRVIRHYNLDAIISVGYRVNSRQGTHFRIWANRVLRDHLVRGYSLNQRRLEAQQERIGQLQKTLTLFREGLIDQAGLTEARGLVSVITGYARTFVLLNQFDSERLGRDGFAENIRYLIDPADAFEGIAALKADLMAKGEASDLFGRPKDESFEGLLGNIVQSFDGQFLYPSIEEQAANLLYLVIKNHPFTDGNKRIGAFLFIWFLRRNRHHLKSDGELKINDNALAAIALLVAQSDPRQKDLMVHLVMNLILG
ncbi:virulence protein RhuM/Fic/DOC family protein [Metapseudomonas furukawaii]|uniref:DNA-binding protein in cluster with Type I restriction-modification system n=2 Tax=Metapseudomonas furukawaii TaxID=1149133 RepID=A0AAD1BYV1_METFU|nr:virulence protein RhuM/Fic/DOC family protein [Pseudomonas furukawaii]ELS28790.1 Putative DNA-binding protein in cluster with Type I restriction-modification system [Pseudomonas furukawaii]BAU73566.1 putative DNA-binding protein in cluster with Type I restriction-modification system [Pseudomonas furukawaii]